MFRSVARRLAAILFMLSVPFTTHAQPRDPLPRVFLEVEDVEQAASMVAASGTASKHVGLRVRREHAPKTLPAQAPPIWLVVSLPANQTAVDGWRRELRGLLDTLRPAILELSLARESAQLARFVVQAAATDAGVSGPVVLAVGGEVSLNAVYTSATAPYIDAVVVRNADREVAERHIAKVDPDSSILLAPADVNADRDLLVLVDIFRTVGTNIPSIARAVDAAAIGPVLKAVASVERILAPGITEIDPKASRLRLTIAGDDVTTGFPHRLLFDNATLATLLIYWGNQRSEPLAIEVAVPVEGVPVVRNVMTGERSSASGYVRDAESSITRAQVPLTGALMIVDFNEGSTEVFSDRTGVSAIRRLTAEEIIARHRQQQRRQDAAIESYIANVRLHQHFRPTVTDPGYDVVTENRYFVDRAGVEWEELSFSVNGSKWGNDRPPFPLLQPEKVLSLPLDLRFDEDYRYTLEGTGTMDGYDCYLIGFEPVTSGQSLYKGTLWIDAKTFGRIRVKAVQTGLSAPVVSNEEVQVYRPVDVGNNTPAFLLSDLTARQIILIAGRNLLLEKAATFETFDINPKNFIAERDRARRSDAVMYRETDRGLRYFVKEGEGRVVSERATTTAKAMAIGVTIDPSYDFPLPIFGINYLDFEFRNPDTQLAILFAGVLAAGNIQRPKIGRTPFDASLDFFAIAVPSNDRIYRADGEQPSERLLTWPLTAGGNLGWQYTAFQKAAVQYQFRFDGYIKDRDTAESFVPPPSTTTHGLGLQWEYRRGGYSVVLNGTLNRRLGWRTWGDPSSPEISKATYAKYSASLSRDFVLGPFQKIHVDGAWFGGDDLDRLSRYQFGLFEATRIHGVPSSGLRFDDILLARGSYSFNVFDQYRLDLFVDQAWGRDQTFGNDRQPITGIGAAVNFRTPWWGTLLRADVGKAFLPDRYDGIGSTVVQVMLQKPLR